MRKFFKYVAILGLLATLCGKINEVTGIITIICIALWIFYPGNRDE